MPLSRERIKIFKCGFFVRHYFLSRTKYQKIIFFVSLPRRIFSLQKQHHIIVRHHNTAIYGDKSLTALGSKIWNKLPTNIKSLTSITKFKEYIRTWFGSWNYIIVCIIVPYLGLVANVTFAAE